MVTLLVDDEGRIERIAPPDGTVAGHPAGALAGQPLAALDASPAGITVDALFRAGGEGGPCTARNPAGEAVAHRCRILREVGPGRHLLVLEEAAPSAGSERDPARDTELLRLRRQQAALLNATADFVILVDPDGTIVECNDVTCRQMGLPRNEIVGLNILDETPLAEFQRRQDRLETVLASGLPSVFDDVRNDRHYVHSLYPVLAPGGQAEGVAIFVKDVTEQRRMERDWQVLFDQMMDGLAEHRLICDEQGTPVDCEFLAVNPAFERITGLPVAQVIGRKCSDVLPLSLPRWLDACSRVALTGEGARFESYCEEVGKWFEVAAFQTGRQGFATVIHDITGRRRTAEALRQSEHNLAQRNTQLESALADLRDAQQKLLRQERLRILETMASGIAHDFNNSLAVIRGFCDLLTSMPARRRDDEKLLLTLSRIREASDDAAATVAKMRLLYRRDDDRQPAMEPTDLARLLREVIELTRPRWQDQALREGITIALKEETDALPPVVANSHELRQAFTHLLMNAADAIRAKEGCITVRLYTERQSAIVEVADSGVGMDEATLARCMDPFFTTKGPAGSGLGLSIVQSIALHHQGVLSLASTPGQGTVATLRLPLPQPLPAAAPDPAASAGPARHYKILVAEDEALIREILGEFLEAAGHIAVMVEDGKGALDCLQGDPFDLLITDRAMPDMHGDQLALSARQLDPQLPVIMVTGFGLDMTARDELPPGVDRLLPKPVVVDDLYRAIRDVCGG